MENLSEGILLIVTGVVVVLVLLVLIALLVRSIILLDDYFSSRQAKKAGKAQGGGGHVSEDGPEVSPEVAAAISLALNDHFQSRFCAPLPELTRQRSLTWTTSGRTEIMSANQKITNRLR